MNFGEVWNGLRWLKGNNLASDIDGGFQALAEDVADKMVAYQEGSHAGRPEPGHANRIYYETDSETLWHDTGEEWVRIEGLALTKTETYGALTARAGNTAYTPSATRPAFVVIYFTHEVGKSSKLKIGGVEVGLALPETGMLSFIVPAGQTWEVGAFGLTGLQSNYLLL